MDKEIKEILEKRGYKKIWNVCVNGEETTTFYHLVNNDIVRVIKEEMPDGEIIEQIKDELKNNLILKR